MDQAKVDAVAVDTGQMDGVWAAVTIPPTSVGLV